MNSKRGWFILIFFVLTNVSLQLNTWELNDNMIKPLDSVTSANGFAIFGGELAYVENSKLHIGSMSPVTVTFTTIESFVKVNGNYFICPADENAKIVKVTSQGTATEIPFDKAPSKNYKLKCAYYSEGQRIVATPIGDVNSFSYNCAKEKWDTEIYGFGIFQQSREVWALGIVDTTLIALYSAKRAGYDKAEIWMEILNIRLISDSDTILFATLFNLDSYYETPSSEHYFEAGFYMGSASQGEEYKVFVYLINSQTGKHLPYIFNKLATTTDKIVYYQKDNDFTNIFGGGTVKLIKNISGTTQFVYVNVNDENKRNWGILDFESSLVVFNSEEEIDGDDTIYPITNMEKTSRAFVIKKNGKYQVVCTNNNDKDQILLCPLCASPKTLIIDFMMGNQCFEIPDDFKGLYWNYKLSYSKCPDNKHVVTSTGLCTDCSEKKDLPIVSYSDGSCMETCKGQTIGRRCKHCKEYDQYYDKSSQVCVDLPIGYYANDNNEKIKCNDSCAKCKDGKSCTVCADGYTTGPSGTSGLCSPCYELCGKCSAVGTESNQKCDTCISGGLRFENNNCIVTCSKLWYIESKEVKCVDSCPSSFPITYTAKNQCLKSCAGVNMYNHNNKCVSSCPSGYEKNDQTHTCKKSQSSAPPADEEEDPELDLCVLLEISLDDFGIDSDIQKKAQELVQQYLKEKDNEYLVEVITGNKIKLTIYKKAKCANKFSIEKNISYANLQSAQSKLAESNGLPQDSEFVVGQIEMAREDQVTDQLSGYIITDDSGNPYDLSPLSEEKINVTYPVSTDQLKFFERGKTLAELGVDIYNPADPFFNDFCFPYTDENGKDVTIKDRREHIFQNGSFCENECDYQKMDFKNARVTCECKVKPSLFDKIFQNGDADDFPIKLNLNNLMVVRCYNLVFSSEYFPTNIGGWVQLIFFLTQIGLCIWFFVVGFGPMQAFIYNLIEDEKASDPANSIAPDKGEEQQAPKPHPPRKIARENVTNETTSKTMMTNDKLTTTNGPSIILNRGATMGLEINGPTKLVLKDDPEKPHQLASTKTMEPSSVLKISSTLKQDESVSSSALNELEYEDAREKDSRPAWKFYLSVLIDTLSFTKPFFGITPLEPLQFRLVGFILMLGFYLALNAMFYDDSYVEARYNANSSTGFLYLIQNEIEKSVYASICICALNFVVNYAIGFKKVYETISKQNKNDSDTQKVALMVLKSVKIRLIIFLVVQFIVMFFFWYYVSAFCAMYQENQGPLFISSILTVVLTSIWQALIVLCITILRYIGLKCKIPLFYNISQYFL